MLAMTTTSRTSETAAKIDEVFAADGRPVEPRHPLRVDEDLADSESGQEGGRHPGAVLVEELDQVEVGAHGDDQRRPLLEGKQHRNVLGWSRGRNHKVIEFHLLNSLLTGCATVCVGVDDQLCAAAQRVIAGRVHVSKDQVGLQPLLADRVGAAIHPDQQRPHVVDVGAQRAQVLLVVGPANDDQHVPVAKGRPRLGQRDRPDQQLSLLLDMGHRVLRESRKRVVDPVALALERLVELLAAQHIALRHHLVAGADPPLLVDADLMAVAQAVERLAPGASTSVTPASTSSKGPALG